MSSNCNTCKDDSCSAKNQKPGESGNDYEDREKLMQRLCKIKHKVIVLSGKGGVGKSTVASSIAQYLAATGKATGLMDVDIHGPSIPKILGLEDAKLEVQGENILPAATSSGLKVMSIGFLLQEPGSRLPWIAKYPVFGIRRKQHICRDGIFRAASLLLAPCRFLQGHCFPWRLLNSRRMRLP